MDIRITKTDNPKAKTPDAQLGFGRIFTDHLFAMDWTEQAGWHDARIDPYAPFAMDPASSVLHYGQSMFEGSKAFRGDDGVLRLFRPLDHMKRMARGAERLCLPPPPPDDALQALEALVQVERDWVPSSPGTALYLRPTLLANEAFLGVRPSARCLYFIIASPVGSYYGGAGPRPVRIWVEKSEVRAPRGGLGSVKASANYAASLHAAHQAKLRGYDQVLWMDARDHAFVEEVGTMNLFVVLGDTLVTPALSDSILAGITRDSVLQLARDEGRKVEERPLPLAELLEANRTGQLKEIFGTGTAAVISPVGELAFDEGNLIVNGGEPGPVGQAYYDHITGLQRGLRPDPHGWMVTVD